MRVGVWFATISLATLCPVGLPAEGPPADDWITPDARKAIDTGLVYLATNQADDGSWGTGDHRGSLALTALAGEAFLAAGHQPGRGPEGARLTKAVEYVLQNETDGLLAREGQPAPMYEHAFTVRFLAEAYGKVTDKALKDRMKATLTRAVHLIVTSQTREGGWRYQPAPIDADVSATACQLHALAAAKQAGFDVPAETIDRGVKYVCACQDLKGGDGGFHYTTRFGPTAFARSAAAVSALRAVGFAGDKEVLEKGTAFVRGFKPPGGPDVHFYYGHYYAARAMRAAGGKAWEVWYRAIRDELLGRQKDGHWTDPTISPHFATAVALVILQSPQK
jgi:hypothetical protein